MWEKLLEDLDPSRLIVAARGFYVIVQQLITQVGITKIFLGNFDHIWKLLRRIFYQKKTKLYELCLNYKCY